MRCLTHDLAAAAVDVADHISHELFGSCDIDFHDRFEDDRLSTLRAASFTAIDPQILNAISLESTSW